MNSARITTVVKMLESLPESGQNLAVEHLREYIAQIQDEETWDALFSGTQSQLTAAALSAKKEMAAGKAEPMDENRL